ncbi:hypothetical protein [Thauera humireducens]|uniref:hypothetical protein n=1 Tax=Thauera humireducens TaxID=1134435 RepID=UPI00311D35AF
MAAEVLSRAGSDFGRAVRWLFWLTAFLSMWISNTATAAMMLPLALGLLTAVSPRARPRDPYLCAARRSVLRQYRRHRHACGARPMRSRPAMSASALPVGWFGVFRWSCC